MHLCEVHVSGPGAGVGLVTVVAAANIGAKRVAVVTVGPRAWPMLALQLLVLFCPGYQPHSCDHFSLSKQEAELSGGHV